MSNPNYKALSLFRLKELAEITTDEFTVGDVLYSIFRKVSKPTDASTVWMRDISDKDFYEAIEKALNEEKEWILN